nr:hypothetical protein KS05_02100 [Rhizobium brockwellii]
MWRKIGYRSDMFACRRHFSRDCVSACAGAFSKLDARKIIRAATTPSPPAWVVKRRGYYQPGEKFPTWPAGRRSLTSAARLFESMR